MEYLYYSSGRLLPRPLLPEPWPPSAVAAAAASIRVLARWTAKAEQGGVGSIACSLRRGLGGSRSTCDTCPMVAYCGLSATCYRHPLIVETLERERVLHGVVRSDSPIHAIFISRHDMPANRGLLLPLLAQGSRFFLVNTA